MSESWGISEQNGHHVLHLSPHQWELVRSEHGLTVRQLEAVRKFLTEETILAVARRMDLHQATVKAHLRAAYAKFRAGSKTELVLAIIACLRRSELEVRTAQR